MEDILDCLLIYHKDLLKPPSALAEDAPQQIKPALAPEAEQQGGTGLTEDEERELAELMGDDE